AISEKRTRPQNPDSYQQHQPHTGRREPRTSRCARRRFRDRLRRNGDRVMTSTLERAEKPVLSEADFIAGFHALGAERYHHKHQSHQLMHDGQLTRGQLQAWALNRYYYQSHIPIKDATILSRSDDHTFRVAWRKRVLDQDGTADAPGGLEKWLKLVEATGLSRVQAVVG